MFHVETFGIEEWIRSIHLRETFQSYQAAATAVHDRGAKNCRYRIVGPVLGWYPDGVGWKPTEGA